MTILHINRVGTGVTSHCTVSYAVDMTTKGQPGRVIRIDDETWADFGQLCEEKGIARATDIRMYVVREVTAWRKQQARQGAIERRLKSLDSD
jgi:hypothetical protein